MSQRSSEPIQRVAAAAVASRTARAVLMTTRDRDHALTMLRATATSANRPLFRFTVSGRYRYDVAGLTWASVATDTADLPQLLGRVRELPPGALVVLEDTAQQLRDEGGDARARMLLADMLAAPGSSQGVVMVFLEPPDAALRLPSLLADQFVRVEVSYPRATELEMLAREELAIAAGGPIVASEIKAAAPKLAAGLAGLTRSAARDALRDALVLDPVDVAGAATRLETRKREQLQRDLAMRVLDTDAAEMPIGLDYLVDYLETIRERLTIMGSDRARGVLLIGPPGTGKTMLARAIGALVKLPVVEFRIAALMNSLLGATEQRFAQAFATLEAMSPNVVFIDEIEKAFGGDQTERDGGTMMRCTGALLSWLSDNPYPNFIVATSNNLTRMGEIGLTMTRSERFDASFFVDVPSRAFRAAMLDRWLQGKVADPSGVASALADGTARYSGADLRSIVKHASARAERINGEVTMDLLAAEVERKRSRVEALYREFESLRAWGRLYCEPAGPTD